MNEIEKKVNELYDFIETHYTEKNEYPKYLYDILEDFIDMEKENQELLVNKNVAQGIAKKFKEENDKLKNIIKVFVGYILMCKPIDFDTYLNSLCDDTEIELITELLKEILVNE